MTAGTLTGAMAGWTMTGLVLLALGAGAAATLHVVDRQRPPVARAAELSYLPKGEYLKVAVLGYRQLVADLIWLKAVQHFGKRYQTTEGYRWAYHAVDVLTDLDPKFAYAYQAGGTILGVWANLVHESIALLEKGIRHNPGVWELPFLLGYDYYFELNDLASAAKYYRIAATLPGSPPYLPKLAARMTAEAGDSEAALEMLHRMYQGMPDDRLREALADRIREVMAERDVQLLEEAARRYRARFHAFPARLTDLVAAGILREIPSEPLGGRYVLNPANGTVVSTGLGGRLRVHRH